MSTFSPRSVTFVSAFCLSTSSLSFSSRSNFHFFVMSSWTRILPLVLEESRQGDARCCKLLKVESWRHYFKCLTDVRQVLCLVTQSNRGENLSPLSQARIKHKPRRGVSDTRASRCRLYPEICRCFPSKAHVTSLWSMSVEWLPCFTGQLIPIKERINGAMYGEIKRPSISKRMKHGWIVQ